MGSSAVLQPVSTPPDPEPHQPISGFWRRFFAFVIDGILLAILGLIVGGFVSDQLAALGGWDRLIGLGIATLYFGLQNSSLADGRTLGKRLLGIRVVNVAGQPISPGISLLRSFIFLLPWQLNQAELPLGNLSQTGTTVVLVAQSAIIFGLGFLTIYLAIFNARTRQSVHDLLARTYVVRSGNGTVVAPKIWRGHWVVLSAAFAIMLVAGAFVYQRFAKTPTMQGLLQLQNAINASGEFRPLSVMKGTMYSTGGNYTYLTVTARVTSADDLDRATDELAVFILRTDPAALGTDRLVVTVVYGYDLGFANFTRSWRDDKSIPEWRAHLGPKLQTTPTEPMP